MANIYLDANVLVDLIGDNKFHYDEMLSKGNKVVVSALNIHILFYVSKAKVPSAIIKSLIKSMILVEMGKIKVNESLKGPTVDFEDNVQLHSAVMGKCDYFLTQDKKLLKMKHFGDVKICDKLE